MENFVLSYMPVFGCRYIVVSAVRLFTGEYTEDFSDSTFKKDMVVVLGALMETVMKKRMPMTSSPTSGLLHTLLQFYRSIDTAPSHLILTSNDLIRCSLPWDIDSICCPLPWDIDRICCPLPWDIDSICCPLPWDIDSICCPLP